MKNTFQNAEHVIKTMRDTNAVLIDEYYNRYENVEADIIWKKGCVASL